MTPVLLPFVDVGQVLPDGAHLIFEGDDAGLHNLQGIVAHGLGDAVLFHLAEVAANFREQHARDDQAHVLVDDGLDEALEAVHQVVLPQLEDGGEDGPVPVREVAVRHLPGRQLLQLRADGRDRLGHRGRRRAGSRHGDRTRGRDEITVVGGNRVNNADEDPLEKRSHQQNRQLPQ